MAVEVSGSRAGAAGTLQLDAPAWRIEPATQAFRLAAAGDRAQLTFTVTPPAQPATAVISAQARNEGTSYSNRAWCFATTTSRSNCFSQPPDRSLCRWTSPFEDRRLATCRAPVTAWPKAWR